MNGTTLKIYRYLYKQGTPQRLHDVQRGLGLSSASVALYHIRKLLDEGLIKEGAEGYVVDRVLFENMIRIRRSVIPFETTYSIFFVATLVLMLTVFFPSNVTGGYVFAVFVNVAALSFFLYETTKALRQKY